MFRVRSSVAHKQSSRFYTQTIAQNNNNNNNKITIAHAIHLPNNNNKFRLWEYHCILDNTIVGYTERSTNWF